MDRLNELESNSIYLIREAHKDLGKMALLWSMGKDSTALVWLARKAFFGELPFPVLHLDTGYKFPEMYRFRDEFAKKWQLRVIVARNETAIADGMGPAGKIECCTALKTEALRQAVEAHGFKVRERERLGSSTIGRGLALLHAELPSVSGCVVAVGRSTGGVSLHSLDVEKIARTLGIRVVNLFPLFGSEPFWRKMGYGLHHRTARVMSKTVSPGLGAVQQRCPTGSSVHSRRRQ